MKATRLILASALAALVVFHLPARLLGAGEPDAPDNVISLAGDWRFALDRAGAGLDQKWFDKDLPDKIKLPGILQAQGYGDEISATTPWVARLGATGWRNNPELTRFTEPGNYKVPFLSQPERHYIGVAWYQRDIDIPAEWAGKRVELFLARARWQSTVWIDDQQFQWNDSLVAPHVTDLGTLAPGQHRLSIRLDNDMMYRMGTDGHSVSDAEGATWNGIVGRIELRATTPVWIDDAQVYPNLEQKSVVIKVVIGNASGQSGAGTLSAGSSTKDVTWDAKGGSAELEVALGPDAQLWDEFHPNLQHLTLTLTGGGAKDAKLLTFGLREIDHDDKDLLLNDRLINVRATHDGGGFPLTGYPAMDVASWKKIFQTCKDYGLNGMRFHSWCPPEAAFTAADEMGFYLQPECGFWDSFETGSPMAKRLDEETERILKAYGNHPSFLFLSPSNETGRSYPPVWATTFYQRDPRRLYSAGTGNDTDAQVKNAQFAVMPHTSNVTGGGGLLRTNNSDNSVWFGGDYISALANVHIPVLAHELGQWCAYPDFDQIKEFTGFLRPGNLEIFRASAAAHGVLDRNKEFAWASGKFQLACYKAEIETNLRTSGLSGFELLDLHDYLGQGTALIGVVDALWQPKSYVSAAEFARFAGPSVPLARLKKRTFLSTEKFYVDVEMAHYGDAPIPNARPYWKIEDLAGHVLKDGEWNALDIPLGKNTLLGDVSQPLSQFPAPAEYKLVVGLVDTNIENDWNFWVYPAPTPADPQAAGVFETNSWPDAQDYLAKGGKVLYIPNPGELVNSPPLSNVPVFWNRQMNPREESMLGLWCDARHPALAEFPTEGFCDWEWADLVRGVRAINIEGAPAKLKPIVSAVDDWNRNWKLAVLFEAKVGPGRLLVSAIPFAGNTTAPINAAQLHRSLLDYMASPKFQPGVALTRAEADNIWKGSPIDAAIPAGAPPPEVDEGLQTPARTN